MYIFARIYICTVSLRSIKNIYSHVYMCRNILHVHICIAHNMYLYVHMFFWIQTCIHVHVMWCVYICVCMCWNPVNMPGCGRDGGFVTMKLRLDHHLPRRPCTFLHEMGGFTHEWSLQLLPFDEGIYLMWKSFVKGQYLRWLRLLDWWLPVIAFINICQLPIFATKLWSYITFPKVKSNQLS